MLNFDIFLCALPSARAVVEKESRATMMMGSHELDGQDRNYMVQMEFLSHSKLCPCSSSLGYCESLTVYVYPSI